MKNDGIPERSRGEVIAAVIAALQGELAQDGFEAQVILLTFPIGHVVVTPDALEALEDAGQVLSEFLARHCARDWGELDADDRRINNDALRTGGRLLSAYRLDSRQMIWIIVRRDKCGSIPAKGGMESKEPP